MTLRCRSSGMDFHRDGHVRTQGLVTPATPKPMTAMGAEVSCLEFQEVLSGQERYCNLQEVQWLNSHCSCIFFMLAAYRAFGSWNTSLDSLSSTRHIWNRDKNVLSLTDRYFRMVSDITMSTVFQFSKSRPVNSSVFWPVARPVG